MLFFYQLRFVLEVLDSMDFLFSYKSDFSPAETALTFPFGKLLNYTALYSNAICSQSLTKSDSLVDWDVRFLQGIKLGVI